MENVLGIDEYSCVKDGGEFPVYDCPECGYDQLVYDAEADKYHCFHCSEDFTSDQLFVCSECNRLKYRNGDAICTECADALMAKKD